ncbi:TspO/MBR family protein [Sphingomonas yantingensis]|uniref:Tryptophan-rich sensory protein n=1 Tax=Sphingomonas yantingensis TaxID=1241761 RepID=A0A7W9EK59_9SPHN|nr:TspO/MBR family protein [Sphingomonas yantingensis]MBB5699331.1 tryptophan-rich sensory protein [Sphingomonas yantingensis]
MREIASKGQLRWSFARWAFVTVPLVLFLGFAAGAVVPSGDANPWYQALSKPSWQPPGWAFPVVWSILYILMGVAIAMILNARGAKGRGIAIALFVAQLLVNLTWSIVFFGMHLVSFAAVEIIVILALAIATTFALARVRRQAAWLMVPYLAWLTFASILAFEIDRLNPDGETLVPSGSTTQIQL